jgi:hypothetical protein
MAGVFQNIDPRPPAPKAGGTYSPGVEGGGHTRRRRGGWGVNILEDVRVRHSSLLYVCKYFVFSRKAQRMPLN